MHITRDFNGLPVYYRRPLLSFVYYILYTTSEIFMCFEEPLGLPIYCKMGLRSASVLHDTSSKISLLTQDLYKFTVHYRRPMRYSTILKTTFMDFRLAEKGNLPLYYRRHPKSHYILQETSEVYRRPLRSFCIVQKICEVSRSTKETIAIFLIQKEDLLGLSE